MSQDTDTGLDQFGDDLHRLITRARKEYDLSYGMVIGTLTLLIHNLCKEAAEDEEVD